MASPLTPEVSLLLLGEPVLERLVAQDLDAASELLGHAVPAGFLDDTWLWEIRLNDLRTDPRHAPWLVRAVLDTVTREVVGHAGFHGAPEDGVLSVGYTILPEHRGRGYATAALAALIDEARDAAGVTTVQATTSPDNAPSLGVIGHWPFALVGERIDDVDGLELIYDLALR